MVGPAVPLEAFTESLALVRRLSHLGTLLGEGPIFVDDHLLELACSSDPMVVRALQRKHLVGLEGVPEGGRGVLLGTLHEWLRHWGQRTAIAQTLTVHPQTVSGRMNRLRELLADDLENPRVRSELLVLLTAMPTIAVDPVI